MKIMLKVLAMFFAITVCMPVFADIVVVISQESKLQKLDASQTKNIFLKKVSEIEGLRLIPLDLSKGDETRNDFYSVIAGKNEDNMLAYWSRLIFTGKGTPPQTAADNQELQYLLSRNPDLVGYIPESDLDPDFNLKVVFKISK